jgi:opacity protein-like surface antigen
MNKHLKNGFSILIFIFSLYLASSAFAGGYVPAQPYFDGFYAGLGGGVVSSTADTKTTFTIDQVAIPTYLSGNGTRIFSATKKMDLGKHGVNGNVFAGFGRTLNSSYYLGGELFGNLFSPKMKGSVTSTYFNISTEVKSPYSFGGDIRGGYLIYPKVMLYVLFGLDYAKFKVDTSAWYTTTGSMSNDFSKWKLGYMPGLGVEIGLCEYLSLRAQYTYTFYPSFSHSSVKIFPRPPNKYDDTLKTKVDPSRGLFTLKLSYLF